MKKIILLISLFTTIISSSQEEYTIKNLEVNTSYSDYGVTYFGDSIAIYASTKRERATRNRIWQTNDQPYLELYSGILDSTGEINNSENFSKVINSKFHESNVAFTKDLKTVYFSRDNSIDGKKSKRSVDGWVLIQLYKATVLPSGEWTNITAMPFNSDNYQTGHPSLNDAEDTLYFTSDMPGGFGMTDIYKVKINEDGTYNDPINLGQYVNTEQKEMFPYIRDNGILYFSSVGQEENYGGLDIYSSKKNELGVFSAVTNLKTPINSANDDFALVYQKNKKAGHFSSNRIGGKGDDDIYFFEDYSVCKQLVSGIVKIENTEELVPFSKVSLFSSDGNELKSVTVKEDAKYVFEIICDQDYKLVASKKEYNQSEQQVITTNFNDIVINLELEKIEEFIAVDDKIIIKINPIYFDFDKSNIRKDAAFELQKVIAIMKKYPELIVEGGSHTDSRGRRNYNEKLSSRRANSTVDYIIKEGKIDRNRIYAKGYGQTQLTNRCFDNVKCTDEEHQLNRRTEFVIINPEVLNK